MAFFSSNSADYARAIQSLVKPTYQSKYGSVIEDQLNKILNRESFSYDFNADPLYQNYKDQYTKLGKEAAMNAAAAASTLTGGYGNSYAGTAAAQANQQYLTQLNERIPELHNAALSKYNMETEDMFNKFNTVQSEENRLYGQYRDQVSDYYSDLSDLRGGHSVAQTQENADRDFNYKVGRDSVSDNQWAKQFEYQKSRDAVADSQWQKEYELALKKARSSGGSGGGSSKQGKYTTNTTWEGGLVQDGQRKVRFTQKEAEEQVGKLSSPEAMERLIDTWLSVGYITENDAAILMDKFKL